MDCVTFLDASGGKTLSSLLGLLFFPGAAVTVFMMFALLLVSQKHYCVLAVVLTFWIPFLAGGVADFFLIVPLRLLHRQLLSLLCALREFCHCESPCLRIPILSACSQNLQSDKARVGVSRLHTIWDTICH